MFSEAVFVSVQTINWFDVRVPAEPVTGFCASSPALELIKHSVPRLSPLNCVPGD